MASFFKYHAPEGTGRRLTGFQRFRELLERDWKRFLLTNLLTILGFLPFVLGVLFSILSSSVLVLVPACVIGGAIAGPSLACMYDSIFRSLRDAPGKFLDHYRHAWKQNWRQSILPGILFCLLIGFYAFMLMMFWWATRFPGFGTLSIYLVGLVLLTMFFSVYWPQLVLFEQTGRQRFQNCLLFMVRFFWKTFGCALLQILYWAFMFLFFPLSVILLPITGIWFILYAANFLLYDTMNEVFHIEEQIAVAFPEQAAFYEDDETWLKKKQEEQAHAKNALNNGRNHTGNPL